MGDSREGADVGDLGGGVRDCRDVDQLRAGPDCFPDRVVVGDEGRFDPVPFRRQLREQSPDSLVGDVGDDHVIASAQQGEEYPV
ncbi:hypothetical protein SAMN05216274_103264 [Cryobacterium levicorallinum]|uniref:Uncharacterized protein n=1 Tax=Cryobacterium levicorallinum TaxID=995038 RepID=A0ABY1EBE2_9MICO|nr:hypothetical protein SAMN05216274_103264 [Cryobacterium levicorallinum]